MDENMETINQVLKSSHKTQPVTATLYANTQSNIQIGENINQMLTLEMESFYLYTAIEIYLYQKGLNGMAKWAKIQAAEELEHFNQHIGFAKNKRLTVNLPKIAPKQVLFASPLEAFGQALAQEIKLGDYYSSLDLEASTTNNYSFSNHLHKFVHEQDEEIDLLDNIVNRLALAGSEAGLILLDQELGQRQ